MIWGEGIVFTWFLNLTDIPPSSYGDQSGCYLFGSEGLAERREGSYPICLIGQPLFPMTLIVFAVLMFEGWAAVKQEPFEAKVKVHLC